MGDRVSVQAMGLGGITRQPNGVRKLVKGIYKLGKRIVCLYERMQTVSEHKRESFEWVA